MLILVIFLSVLQIATAATSESQEGYPVLFLALCCCVTVALSAIYCGLTIGIMGMDETTLEIIASAGPYPDCKYAGNILPLRRLGHRLLVTLLLGNMLTLVLTSQFISSLLHTSSLVKFVTSTVLILVFGEIIPMSICSNGKYALYLGSTSIPILRLSLVILYPVAMPLSALLDCLVPHGAGDVFDREELKRLIALHSEKFASKTGIGGEESQMIIGALELKEACVQDVMTPLEEVLMIDSGTLINSSLEKDLWQWGKSRIPVYTDDRSNIIGLLYVKSLLGILTSENSKYYSVGEFVQEHSIGSIVVVSKQMSLLHVLSMFERNHIQLAFVADTCLASVEHSQSSNEADSPSSGKHGTSSLEDSASQKFEENQFSFHKIIPQSELSESKLHFSIVGIITMEDVIEKLISSQILDEDEFDAEHERSRSSTTGRAGEEATLEGEEFAPRVNFFSFGVSSEPLAVRAPLSLNENWAVAQFLSRTYVFFATWSIPHIVTLLHEVGDIIVYPEMCHSSCEKVLYTSNVPSQTFTLLLGGSASVRYDVSIETEIRSFASLGDEVLGTCLPFLPQFTATISRPSRFIQITLDSIRFIEEKINRMRLYHRELPIEFLPSKQK